MKDHEKSSLIVDSTTEVEEIVTEKVKIEGSLGARVEEGEDMMVDVVGADSVDSDRKSNPVRLVEERKEMEPRDLNTDMKEEGAGSGGEEDVCHVSAGTSVLPSEKAEVMIKEEGLETSTEVRDCEMDIEPKEEPRDIDVTEKGSILEQRVESVEEVEERARKESEARDLKTDMEEAVVVTGEDVCRDSVGSRVLAFEKVKVTVVEEGLNTSLEVSKDVLQGNDDATSCGSLVRDSKESSIGGGEVVVIDSKDLTERGSTKEEHESVEEVAEGDHVLGKKSKKEAEVSDSSKIAESLEVDTIVVEDEAEKSISVDPRLVSDNNQNSSTELVNVRTDEVAGKSKEESLHPTIEVITDDSQGKESVEPRFVGGENDSIDKEEESDRVLPKDITEQPMECDQQVVDGDRVLGEKIVKETETLDSLKVSKPCFVGGEDDSIDKEEESDRGLPKEITEHLMECDQQVADGDRVLDEKIVKESEALDSSKVSEPRSVGGENDSIDKEEESDRGLPKEISEQPMKCDQQVADGDRVLGEKIIKESEPLDSSKVSEPPTATNPASEDVDVVVVDEGLATKDEAQDGVSVDPSSVSVDNRSLPTKAVVTQAENVDQQAEVVPNDARNLEIGTGVGDSKSGVDSSVQVTTYGDVAMDEKTEKGDEVLDSSKIPKSYTTDNLVPKEVLTTKVESQDGDSVGQKLVPESNHDRDGQHVDQLAGPENPQTEKTVIESKQSSVAEMLSQLHSVAQDPMKGSSSLNTIKSFFYDHRAVGRPLGVRKRKTSNENEPEELESDDVNDSYWTDRIVQNHPEEQSVQDDRNGGQERHIVAYEPDNNKPAKANRRSNKKRFMFSNHEMGLKEQSELVERRRQNLATEVVLKFPMGIYFPSEIHLNKMFRRFGALMESETEVDRQSGRARVVFKKCCDAEVAHSSAGKFNIFGPINVNYELNYNPLVSYKPLLLSVLQDSMDTS